MVLDYSRIKCEDLASKINLGPKWLLLLSVLSNGKDSVVCAILCIVSSFVIIPLEKRKMFVSLDLPFDVM